MAKHLVVLQSTNALNFFFFFFAIQNLIEVAFKMAVFLFELILILHALNGMIKPITPTVSFSIRKFLNTQSTNLAFLASISSFSVIVQTLTIT